MGKASYCLPPHPRAFSIDSPLFGVIGFYTSDCEVLYKLLLFFPHIFFLGDFLWFKERKGEFWVARWRWTLNSRVRVLKLHWYIGVGQGSAAWWLCSWHQPQPWVWDSVLWSGLRFPVVCMQSLVSPLTTTTALPTTSPGQKKKCLVNYCGFDFDSTNFPCCLLTFTVSCQQR